MVKRFLCLVFFLLTLLPVLGQAQESHITGRVVDATTKAPIPYVSIGLREEGTGAIADGFGYFQLVGLEKIRRDSLIFLKFGYKRYAILVERGNTESLSIELSKRVISVQGAELGYNNSINICKGLFHTKLFPLSPGGEYAFFLKNQTRSRLGYIRTASFYIGENGFPKETFRIHIYKADGALNTPKADLLTETILGLTHAGLLSAKLAFYADTEHLHRVPAGYT